MQDKIILIHSHWMHNRERPRNFIHKRQKASSLRIHCEVSTTSFAINIQQIVRDTDQR